MDERASSHSVSWRHAEHAPMSERDQHSTQWMGKICCKSTMLRHLHFPILYLASGPGSEAGTMPSRQKHSHHSNAPLSNVSTIPQGASHAHTEAVGHSPCCNPSNTFIKIRVPRRGVCREGDDEWKPEPCYFEHKQLPPSPALNPLNKRTGANDGNETFLFHSPSAPRASP